MADKTFEALAAFCAAQHAMDKAAIAYALAVLDEHREAFHAHLFDREDDGAELHDIIHDYCIGLEVVRHKHKARPFVIGYGKQRAQDLLDSQYREGVEASWENLSFFVLVDICQEVAAELEVQS